MVTKLFKKIFGSRNERILRRLNKQVVKINALEPEFQGLSDEQLLNKTEEFKQRLANGEELNQLIPEAFAAVREAAVRTLNMRHFDVQLIGGMALNEGNIAEMLTGEGKTLVATLPAYLNALTGKGVHIITVNDYLAKRDANWMRPVYEALGLTVGVNVPGMEHEAKAAAYKADVIYGTNNEFGFDYLRDNMAFALEDKVQRDHYFAIVDEVDSILIDEARTPLIISGPAEDSSELYVKINAIIPSLTKREEEEGPGDFYLDEKSKQAYLTEDGHARVEEVLAEKGVIQAGESLYDAGNISLMHHIYAALRANTLFQRDVDYVVKNNQVVIVDEHTGRLMEGRRWSDGLHQAVEAKENVAIQNENQTLASITFQNYFRMYEKLSGMTGTADTEAYEFHQIYGLEVIVIPPNKPVKRKDYTDKVYLTQKEKFFAIIDEVQDCQRRGQPVLLGTASIEASEVISRLLQKEKIQHEVLNAKQHEREAHIIAQAGKPGSITIATNMAGRGTDIVLGGNLQAELEQLENPTEEKIAELQEIWKQNHAKVIDAGGLHVLGSERHESRRIDNQLRGRSGRQGDPGSSSFFLSLEDNLLRIFASDKLQMIMQRLGVPEGEALESPMLTRVIENAQRKVEGHNFDIRKQLLEFDNVANEQRKVIYSQRDEIMEAEDVSETIQAMLESTVDQLVEDYIPADSFEEQWDLKGLETVLAEEFALKVDVAEWLQQKGVLPEKIARDNIVSQLQELFKSKEELTGPEGMRRFEKAILLQSLDGHWKDHLAAMDHLRQGIHLRYYAQKNPKQEYKRESFELFRSTLDNLKREITSIIARVQVKEDDAETVEAERRRQSATPMNFQHQEQESILGGPAQPVGATQQAEEAVTPFVRETPKVGRNQPCPCGSGKKYKQCHGSLVKEAD